MKSNTIMFGLCAVLACQAAASATTVYTWDNAAEGWSGASTYSTTTGVTHGTHSVVIDPPTGFAWQLQTGNWSASFPNALQKTNTTILLDVTAAQETIPDGGDYYLDIWLWQNATSSGIGQKPILTDGLTHTYAFDYAAVNKGGSAAIDWTQMRIVTNALGGFDPGLLHVDNLRIVGADIPEPASLAMAGVAGLGLLARRRK